MSKSKDKQMLSKRKGNVEITLVSTKYEPGKKPEYAEKHTYYEIQKVEWSGNKKEITRRISFSDEEEAIKSYEALISKFITKGELTNMSERTAFAVVNKRGKVVEYTSRIPYQYGQVFYKGDIYQLKNPLPGMKAKRIIMLGTGYPASHKKAIMKSPRKVSKPKVKPTIYLSLEDAVSKEAANLYQTLTDSDSNYIKTPSDVDYEIGTFQASIDEQWMEPYEQEQTYLMIDYLEDYKTYMKRS